MYLHVVFITQVVYPVQMDVGKVDGDGLPGETLDDVGAVLVGWVAARVAG